MSVSEVESKERLWNPERVISCWLLNPGSWAKLTVKPRTQTIPTACKALLPGGEETTPGFTSCIGKDVSAHSSRQGLLCHGWPIRTQTPQQHETCDDHYRVWSWCSSSVLTSLRAMLISISIRGTLIKQGLTQSTVLKDWGYTLNISTPHPKIMHWNFQ